MRRSLLAAAALLAGLTALPAQAADPVLDGKKVKQIKFEATASNQLHPNGVSHASCTETECFKLPFVFKPASGVTGELSIRINWTNQLHDFDLYLMDADNKDVAVCGGGGFANQETIAIATDKLTKGAKYTVLVVFYAVSSDKVVGHIDLPGTDKPGPIYPVSPLIITNCQ